jgi:hypothetical protein
VRGLPHLTEGLQVPDAAEYLDTWQGAPAVHETVAFPCRSTANRDNDTRLAVTRTPGGNQPDNVRRAATILLSPGAGDSLHTAIAFPAASTPTLASDAVPVAEMVTTLPDHTRGTSASPACPMTHSAMVKRERQRKTGSLAKHRMVASVAEAWMGLCK